MKNIFYHIVLLTVAACGPAHGGVELGENQNNNNNNNNTQSQNVVKGYELRLKGVKLDDEYISEFAFVPGSENPETLSNNKQMDFYFDIVRLEEDVKTGKIVKVLLPKEEVEDKFEFSINSNSASNATFNKDDPSDSSWQDDVKGVKVVVKGPGDNRQQLNSKLIFEIKNKENELTGTSNEFTFDISST